MAMDGYVRIYNRRVDPNGAMAKQLKNEEEYFEFEYQQSIRA